IRACAHSARSFASMRHGLPVDALRVEDRAVDARARVVRCATVGPPRRDDATVAAAEAAAHHLLERDVARAAVRGGELGAGAHHGRRAADVQLDGIAERTLAQRGFERHGDPPAYAAAAVFGGEHDADAERAEDLRA